MFHRRRSHSAWSASCDSMSHASSGADWLAAAKSAGAALPCSRAPNNALEKRLGSVRAFQVQRHAHAVALEPAPQRAPAGPRCRCHRAGPRGGGAHRRDRAVPPAPGRFSGRTRRLHGARRRPVPAFAAAPAPRPGIARDCDRRADCAPASASMRAIPAAACSSSRSGQTREVFQQRALVALLRAEQRRPLLKLDEDEGVDRRRQTRQHSPCVAASVAASPVTPVNCIASSAGQPPRPRRSQGKTWTVKRSSFTASEGQLGKRPAFAFRHLEPENPRHCRGHIHRPDRAFRAGALRHACSKGHEPHPAAGLVAAAVVREPVSGHVAVPPQLGDHDQRRAIAVLPATTGRAATARARADRSCGWPRDRANTRRSARCRCPRSSRPAATARGGS